MATNICSILDHHRDPARLAHVLEEHVPILAQDGDMFDLRRCDVTERGIDHQEGDTQPGERVQEGRRTKSLGCSVPGCAPASFDATMVAGRCRGAGAPRAHTWGRGLVHAGITAYLMIEGHRWLKAITIHIEMVSAPCARASSDRRIGSRGSHPTVRRSGSMERATESGHDPPSVPHP